MLKRFLICVTAALALVTLFLLFYSQATSEAMASEAVQKRIEDAIFAAANAEREKAGIAPLERDGRLDEIARAKAQEMLTEGYFAHTSPKTGELPEQFEEFGGITLGENASSMGENIATAQGYPLSELTGEFWVKRWMDSPTHRANILCEDFTHLGVGFFMKGDVAFAAQEFLKT